MNKFRPILIILFLMLSQGCQPSPGKLLPPQEVIVALPTVEEEVPLDIGDGGLISDIPCSAPCFFGITPGVSSNIDVIQNLKQNEIYSGCHMKGSGVSCPGYVIYLDESTLLCETISYNLTDIMTIADVIEKFGNPDLWGVVSVNEHSHQIIDPETIWLSLNYNSLHMEVNLEYQEVHDREYILSPGTKVRGVTYFNNETYHYSGQMVWPGYGSFEAPY
jgi:hypothetical protein